MVFLYDVSSIPDEDKMDREFGGILRTLRINAGYSVFDIHAITRIPESRLLSLESGHATPSILRRELNALSSIYGVNPADLVALLK